MENSRFGRTRPLTWVILAGIVGFLCFWGIPKLVNKYAPGKEVAKSQLISAVKLPDAPKNIETSAPPVAMPTDDVAIFQNDATELRHEIWAWNAQMGEIFANGGVATTKGSIMEKRGVNLKLIRQDDVPTMQAHLVQFAKAYASDKNTKEGVQFVSIMGDGAAAFLAAVNAELEKIGSQYTAKVIASAGKSLGEDKLMGPSEWIQDPQKARGKTIAAYLRDGDWNIVIMWAAANGIPVNPDETTYDPDAINFINPESYIDAAQKYINNYSEERPVVRNGKIEVLSGKHKVTVDGVATWTPGDVMIATKKGGLVSIVSTAEYRSQMANVIIGIDAFMKDNPKLIENFLAGIFEGGDQVKGYASALEKAGELSAKVYNEENGKYWMTYYKGKQIADKTGEVVSLGGSRVNNLADNLQYFGLNSGSSDVYAVVYTTFGDIVSNMYPKLVPTYPQYTDITDFSYLKNVAKTFKPSEITAADEVKFDDAPITTTVSKRAWSITFKSGSAEISPESYATLKEIRNQVVVSSGLKLRIEGHTDSDGGDDINVPLSKARADAVLMELESMARGQVANRTTTQGFGARMPVAPNTTASGKSKNRRVEIIMGT